MFDLLPDELLHEILRHLPAPSVTAVACASRRLSRVAADRRLWRRIFLRSVRAAAAVATDEMRDDAVLRWALGGVSLADVYAAPSVGAAFWREMCLRVWATRTHTCGLCRERNVNDFTGFKWIYRDRIHTRCGQLGIFTPMYRSEAFGDWWHDRLLSDACPYCQTTMLVPMRQLVASGLLARPNFVSYAKMARRLRLRPLVLVDLVRRHESPGVVPRYFIDDVLAALWRGEPSKLLGGHAAASHPEGLLPHVWPQFGPWKSFDVPPTYATIGHRITGCTTRAPSHARVKWEAVEEDEKEAGGGS